MEQSRNTLDRFDSTPLYLQLSSIIRGKIESGEWPSNSMIPSENELSKLYGVSRMTVRNVITQFVTQGSLYRIQGKGTFVSESKMEINSIHYTGIREQLEKLGHAVHTRLLSCQVIHADSFLSGKTGTPVGASLYRIKRVRSVNDIVISYHVSFILADRCPDLLGFDLEKEQLCRLISRKYGISSARTIETLESFIADKEKAEYLGVSPGFPLLLLQNQLYSADGRLYEYTRIYFRGDKIKIRMEHNNSGIAQ